MNSLGAVTRALQHAFSGVPLYRTPDPRIACDLAARDPLGALAARPFISKADIRDRFPDNFLGAEHVLNDLLDKGIVELEYTSGTSEERTPLLLPRGWWNDQERRAFSKNRHTAKFASEGVQPRRVTITSPMCNNDICYTGVPSREERVVGNSLFIALSRLPFLWGKHDLQRMADETVDWAPALLDVDPVYGVAFALFCERRSISLPSLRCIVTSYEYPSAAHVRILSRVFGVPVCNLYGSTETGHLLMQGEAGLMVQAPETAWLELLPGQVASGGVTVHELAVTTLTNPWMPLIRYRMGDLVQPIANGGEPAYLLHGRAADVVTRPEGHIVTVRQVDELVGATPGVAHYQLLEVGPQQFKLRFISDNAPPSAESVGGLREKLVPLLGAGATVECEATDLLMPEKSGKFRLVYPHRAV